MTGVFAGREEETQTQRETGHVKREAGIRVMLPQAKGHLGLPEAGRDKKASSPEALPTLWFWTSSFRNCETINFCCFLSSNLWYFVTAALRN